MALPDQPSAGLADQRAQPVSDHEPAPTADDPAIVTRSRTASTFVAVTVGLALALLMLVFVLQNDQRQPFELLWLDFTLPVGVAMLLASILGGLVVASFGLARVVQLRVKARRHRNAVHA